MSANLNSERKFESFNDTFPKCAFALALGMIYPNRDNLRRRYQAIAGAITLAVPLLYWFFMYIYKCIYNLDIFNLTRNLSVGIVISLFLFKTFYATKKTDQFAQILEKISDDLLKGNEMDDDYKEIYEHYIKMGKRAQTCWIIIPFVLSAQFPIYAGIYTIYESLKTDVGKRYMMHEMEIKHLEDKQYDTPFYEIIFAYQYLLYVTMSPSFAGFDGSFCIATNHLSLKMKLLVQKLKRAFIESKTRSELQIKTKEAIRDHQEALSFYNDLQDVYGGWLFIVFLVTSLCISLNIYQIYSSKNGDPIYIIFAISSIVHMFSPCYFSSCLTKTSEDLYWDLYSVDWERWADPAVTKLLIFMIAKSQQTLILTGKGVVHFNMQLFISILQTSYSLFTLISS